MLTPRFRALGVSGEVRCGYHVAAHFAAGTLIRQAAFVGDETSTLEAAIVWMDGFWIRQEPLDLWIALAPRWWVWMSAAIHIAADRSAVSAIVSGNPEFRE